MKRLVIGALLTAVVGVGARAYYTSQNNLAPAVSAVHLTTGSIVDAIAATGTLQAVTTVQVGTQVSGTILWLGADFNSIVHKGEVIARLDTSLVDAQIGQARASLARAAADVDNSRVQVADAQTKYERAQQLSAKSLIARSELDTARVAVETAQAQLKSSQAQQVQAEASLSQSEVTREHSTIEAPIDGIVIQRSVDVGQTVAASLQSPTIFSIAADLAEMQVQANIDESDIGRIQPGQKVTFTVDAYPGQRFTGTTTQIRLQPTVVQNVTTYTAIIDAPNRDLKLKPGMTASVNIEIARRDAVLKVPNAALRFTPSAEELETLGSTSSAPEAKQSKGSPRVWVRDNGAIHPVAVTAGLSDGLSTEVISGDLTAGAEVITNITTASEKTRTTATTSAGNPFMGSAPGSGFGGARTGGGSR